jgi:hypothetical protein
MTENEGGGSEQRKKVLRRREAQTQLFDERRGQRHIAVL